MGWGKERTTGEGVGRMRREREKGRRRDVEERGWEKRRGRRGQDKIGEEYRMEGEAERWRGQD